MSRVTVNHPQVLRNLSTIVSHLVALGYSQKEIVAMTAYLSADSMPAHQGQEVAS